MAVIYGVLRGKLDRWKREDVPPGSSKSPHLHVRLIDDGGTPWHLAVNVRSGDPAKSLVIFHRADPLQNALDYSRAPLFDLPTGIALPPTGPATRLLPHPLLASRIQRSRSFISSGHCSTRAATTRAGRSW